MSIKNLLAAVLLTGVTTLQGFGQFGQNISSRPDLIGSQRYNPAYLLDGEFDKFRFGASAEGWFGNSDSGIRGIFDTDGYITHETRDRIVGNIKGQLSFSGGYNFDPINVNLKIGNTPVMFYASDQHYLGMKSQGPATIGLIFNGNGPYAGQTVTDEDLSFSQYHIREAGVGAGKSLMDDKLKVAGRVGVLLGQTMRSLKNTSYSLYTGVDGTEMDILADYNFSSTLTDTTNPFISGNGIGFSVDLGMTYQINDKFRVEAAVLNAGMTSWKVKNYENSVDVHFEGINVSSLFADSLSAELEQAADSLLALLLPDSTLKNEIISAPTIFRIGGSMKLSEKAKLNAIIAWTPVKNAPYTQFPMVSVSYMREVAKGLRLSGSAYGGGVDMFGVGAMATYRLGLSDNKMGIEFAAGLDNFLGLLVGSAGRGISGFGGIGFTY